MRESVAMHWHVMLSASQSDARHRDAMTSLVRVFPPIVPRQRWGIHEWKRPTCKQLFRRSSRAPTSLSPFRDRQSKSDLKFVNDQLVSIDLTIRCTKDTRNGTDPVPLCDQLNLRNASSTGWHTDRRSFLRIWQLFHRELYPLYRNYTRSVMRSSRRKRGK